MRRGSGDVASLGASVLGVPPPTHNAGCCLCRTSTGDSVRAPGAALANAEQLGGGTAQGGGRRARVFDGVRHARGSEAGAPLAGANETLAAAKHARVEGHEAAVDAARAPRACVDGAACLRLYGRRLLLWTIASCFL